MKIKKSCIIKLLLSVIFSMSVFCNDNFNIHFETETGFLYGNISEYVYSKEIKNTDNLESQLDWDIRYIPYIEENIDMTLFNYFNTSFGMRFFIPKQSGFMQDYDWLNSDPETLKYYPGWKNDDPTELTNYSISDNFLEQYYLLSFSIGANIPLQRIIIFDPFISYEYEYISLYAQNGYSIYKWNNFERDDFSGKIIAYKQEFNTVFFGLKTTFIPINKFKSDLTIEISPYLTYINAVDLHLKRYVAFLDKILNTPQIKANIKACYTFNSNHQLGMLLGFQYVPVSTGEDYSRSINSEGKYTYGDWSGPFSGILGGTSRTLWNFGLTYTLSF